MESLGKVEKYLRSEIKEKGAIHLTLLDPEKASLNTAAKIASEAEKAGTAAILLGGSTICSTIQVDLLAKKIKKSVSIPLILFPGNVSGVSRFADALFFMSLINSNNPYYIVDAQAISALTIKKYSIEAIPTAYIILGSGGTAGFIGYARCIPYEKPELAVMYSLAAQYIGMRLVYLEAGSGAKEPIPAEVISAVKHELSVPIIVGGGIKKKEDVCAAVKAGADILVTGTLVEESDKVKEKLSGLLKGINR
ncbi:MAG: geranylgeranylglyceryl/heptaprenylglyceryl phosphate synthase [Candidatus Bathyarchaeia archaeon]